MMDNVHKKVIKCKLENSSKEIMRFIGKKKSIAEFAGAWKMTEKEANEMKKTVAQIKADMTASVMQKLGIKQ